MTNFTLPKTILMWANPDPKHPNSFIIKIDNQNLLGLTRVDKKDQTYWKFKERVKKVNKETAPNPIADNIQKFQQRQNQTEQLKNYGNNSHQIKE